MSRVSFIDKLLCGMTVKWVEVGELIPPRRGRRLVRSELEEAGAYAVYQNSLKPLGYYHECNVPAGAAFVVVAGAAGDIGFSDAPFWAADDVYFFSVADAVNNKYLYHFLLAKRHEILSQVRRASVPRLSIAAIEKLLIPIPCPEIPEKSLEIQGEIVRVLDTYVERTVELTAELAAERAARKKQYSHYLERLLSFKDGEVEWKTLPEMSIDFGRGKSRHRPRNDEKLYGGNIPFIQTGDIRGAARIITCYEQTYSELGLKQSKLWPKGTLCITIAANIAETSILGFDACFPDSVIGFVADPSKTSSAYVEFTLQVAKAALEEEGKGRSSAQSNINLGTFEQLRLPFPSLVEQARIVAILDKFDALTNSIIEGLSLEIELRQKQYEYYRNLLLSFAKQDEVAA
ncbi:MAG: restriction endonuclease subunit S [Pseudomonas sp.]